MTQELTEKILKSLYPELKIEVKEFEVLPRKMLNESNEWVEDTPAYFVGVFINEYPSQALNIGETLSSFTSCEFNVYRA